MPTPTQIKELQEKVRQRKAFAFSNFDMWEGSTLEHWYQASKSTNTEEKAWVMAAPTPGEAKRRGGQVKHLRKDWDNKKPAYMWRLVTKKFRPDNGFGALLAGSQGEIVEWNTWHDLFWGKCVCDKHQGQGENWLGVLLMLRRSQLWASLRFP